MECPLSYQEILDAYTVNRWDTGQHFCIRVTIPDGSVLLKVNLKNEFCLSLDLNIGNACLLQNAKLQSQPSLSRWELVDFN